MEGMSQHVSRNSQATLSDGDVAYLECERDHWAVGPKKEQVVFDQFQISLPVYYQRLYRIAAKPEAWKYDPVLVRLIHDTADEVTSKRLTRQGQHRG
jgi:hypothetical protein